MYNNVYLNAKEGRDRKCYNKQNIEKQNYNSMNYWMRYRFIII
jgi:hypothetical protein